VLFLVHGHPAVILSASLLGLSVLLQAGGVINDGWIEEDQDTLYTQVKGKDRLQQESEREVPGESML